MFPPRRWEYDSNQFDSFKNIIEKISRSNTKLILIQAPVTKDFYETYLNNGEFDLEMKKYGLYYNFNKNIILNDSLHFFDYHHLNTIGVELFNKEVIGLVNENAL